MTRQEVDQWFIDNGVPDIAKDEAGYIFDHYGGPTDELGQLGALQGALGGYQQRQFSGGDRSQGGYSTDQNDPAQGNAPARYDSNDSGHLGPIGPEVIRYGSGGREAGGGHYGGGYVDPYGFGAGGLAQGPNGFNMSPSYPVPSPYSAPAPDPSKYVGGPMAPGQTPNFSTRPDGVSGTNPVPLEQLTEMLRRLLGQQGGGTNSLPELQAELRRLGVL